MSITFHVENIKCGGCANSIVTKLEKVAGVNGVRVNIENQEIAVEGSFDENEVSLMLTNMGYPRIGENDFIKKAKSYVSCAIGRIQS
jgi:copper chaperone CopZ